MIRLCLFLFIILSIFDLYLSEFYYQIHIYDCYDLFHACMLSRCSRIWLFVNLWTFQAPLSTDSSDMNTGVGCHVLLHGIFPTQGSNLCILQLLDFIKIKNFCSAEDNIKKIRYCTDRETYVQKTHLIKDCYSNIKRTLKTHKDTHVHT